MADIPRKAAIFGGKGGGAYAAQILSNLARSGWQFAGYLNDRCPVGSQFFGGNVLCGFDAWANLDADMSFVAPLHKAGYMQQHSARIEALGVPEARWATLVDPRSCVAEDAKIGPGSIIAGLATVSIENTIGSHCFVRAGALIGHDAVIEDFGFIGANAVICGYSRIKRGAHIAPAAVVRDGVTVGCFALVGLGAVVTKDVPDYAVMAGNPARIRREIAPT